MSKGKKTLAFAFLFGFLLLFSSPAWSETYVYNYHYDVFDIGTYAQKYNYSTYKYWTQPGTDHQYDTPYNLMNDDATHYQAKLSFLSRAKSAIEYTKSVIRAVKQFMPQHDGQAVLVVEGLDPTLDQAASVLDGLNQAGIAHNEAYGNQMEAQMRARINAWKAAVEQVIQDYVQQKQAQCAPQPWESSTPVMAVPIPEIQGGDTIKVSAYDYYTCATERGYYGYWQGQNFISASYNHPMCIAGKCRCEYIVP